MLITQQTSLLLRELIRENKPLLFSEMAISDNRERAAAFASLLSHGYVSWVNEDSIEWTGKIA